MKTKQLIGIIAVGAIIIGTIIILNTGPNTTTEEVQSQTSASRESVRPSTDTSSNTASVTDSTKQASGYTMTDVAKHTSASSCWTAVNGSVYDVTSWINRHPGGAGAILSMCGRDASNAFDDQHGGQRRPEQELASFFIGKLL